jgi:hypothetical protein
MCTPCAVASVALGGEIPESLRERVYKWEAYAAAARRCDREFESFGARASASGACTDYFNQPAGQVRGHG